MRNDYTFHFRIKIFINRFLCITDKTRNGAVQKVAATVLWQLKNIKIGNEEEDQEEEEEMSEDFTSTLPMAAVGKVLKKMIFFYT